MASLEVGKCGECPYVLQCQDKLEELSAHKQEITQIAVDDNIDEVVAPAFLQIFRETPVVDGVDGSSFETEQDIAAAIRKNVAVTLEEMDKHEEMMITVVNVGTMACNGPLKMRAAKDGITTTATICSNPAMPRGEHTESVVITRETNS